MNNLDMHEMKDKFVDGAIKQSLRHVINLMIKFRGAEYRETLIYNLERESRELIQEMIDSGDLVRTGQARLTLKEDIDEEG